MITMVIIRFMIDTQMNRMAIHCKYVSFIG